MYIIIYNRCFMSLCIAGILHNKELVTLTVYIVTYHKELVQLAVRHDAYITNPHSSKGVLYFVSFLSQ